MRNMTEVVILLARNNQVHESVFDMPVEYMMLSFMLFHLESEVLQAYANMCWQMSNENVYGLG